LKGKQCQKEPRVLPLRCGRSRSPIRVPPR
jgi:hypothetical protein